MKGAAQDCVAVYDRIGFHIEAEHIIIEVFDILYCEISRREFLFGLNSAISFGVDTAFTLCSVLICCFPFEMISL